MNRDFGQVWSFDNSVDCSKAFYLLPNINLSKSEFIFLFFFPLQSLKFHVKLFPVLGPYSLSLPRLMPPLSSCFSFSHAYWLLCFVLTQCLPKWPRLAPKAESSCLSLLSTGTTGASPNTPSSGFFFLVVLAYWASYSTGEKNHSQSHGPWGPWPRGGRRKTRCGVSVPHTPCTSASAWRTCLWV